jgi:hypothetical protein
MPAWLMNLASLAKGRFRREQQKTMTYTYTERKPRRISSGKRMGSSPGGTSSSSGSDSNRYIVRDPNEIRPGYFIVLVGTEKKKFIISSAILNHSLFKLVLQKLRDNNDGIDSHLFGEDDETGAVLLSCDVQFLHRLLFLIDSAGDHEQELRWEELKLYLEGTTNNYYNVGPSCSHRH